MIERIGDGVLGELRRFGPAAGMAEIVTAWPRAVGEQIARNAWPARLARDGTLHVHTESSAWAFELGQLAPTIVERLREELGAVAPAALRFAPGPLPEQVADEADRAASRVLAPGPAERALADELTRGASVEELRKLLARAAAAALARGSADR